MVNGDDMAQWLWWYMREPAGRYIREVNLIDPVSRTDVRVKYALLCIAATRGGALRHEQRDGESKKI